MSEDWGIEKNTGRPSLCRNCGAIVAAGETVCPQCGVPLNALPVYEQQHAAPEVDHETMRFARALFSRSYIFTIVFLVANIFLFLLMWDTSGLSGGSLWLTDPLTLVRYGAKVNLLIDQQHEWWRFVTPVFVHGGLLHLLFNMYGLWMLGPYVERLYGSAKFVVMWVLTGVAGVAASYLSVRPSLSHGFVLSRIFKAQDVASVGASGALFGLIGVLFVFGLKYRHELPAGFKRAFGTGMLPTILLNLFIGFSVRFIDNSAHLGGLLAGALIAFVVHYERPGERSRVHFLWNVLQVLCLLLVVVSFVQVGRHFSDPLPAAATEFEDVTPSGVKSYVKAMNDGEQELRAAITGEDIGGVDAAIEELQNAPSIDTTGGQLKDQLKNFLERAKQIRTAKNQSENETAKQLQQVGTEYVAWVKQRNQWVETDGKKYGFTMRTESK